MGSLFTSDSASQSTSSQQVGVQGASGTTIGVGSGTGGSVASSGSTAFGNVSGGIGGASINITSSDIEADHDLASVAGLALDEEQHVAYDSLAANTQVTANAIGAVTHEADNEAVLAGNAISANSAVSLDSVNAANQIAINALENVHSQSVADSATAHDSLLAAQQIAGQAAPQSAGATAEDLSGINSKTVEYVALAVAVAIGLYFFSRNS